MWVIGRSASPFSGMSVSSSSTGVRPTWASQTATWRSRPGSSTVTWSGSPSSAWTRLTGRRGQVVVGVGVLLVAVGVDRLVEVAVAIEQPDADERQGHVGRRLRVVAGEHAEAAGVDPERLVDPVLGAEVGDGSVEDAAVVPGEPGVGAVRHVLVELAEDVPDLDHERRVVEEAAPLDRARQDRDRIPVAGPRLAVDPAPDLARPRMPAPVEVVGEAAESLELWREPERRGGNRGDAGSRIHVGG